MYLRHLKTTGSTISLRKLNFENFWFLVLLCIACHNLNLGDNLLLRGFPTLTKRFVIIHREKPKLSDENETEFGLYI